MFNYSSFLNALNIYRYKNEPFCKGGNQTIYANVRSLF